MTDRTPAMLALLLALTGTALPAPAADSEVLQPPSTTVEFVHPERFTDVGDRRAPLDEARSAYLDDLRAHIVRRANALLPGGHALALWITDIDMAGDFEAVRSDARHVRTVRDIYPPRIDLSFDLVGPNGKHSHGTRQLRDLTFLMTTPRYTGELMQYEKALIDDWLTRELRSRF